MIKSRFAVFMLLAVFIAFAAHAGEFAALKLKMLEARYSLYILLDNGDKRGPKQQKRVQETADAVSAMLAGMKAPAGREAQFKELDSTWKAFKKTREEELVPLILARKQKEAEEVATGVQNDRFKKMMDLCDALEK
ncbi:MAG TPA: hypothetical protein VFK23_06240 [Nitrospirota bacterium]|nr:hypothetical protein [Nitrospirota bacterium]